VTRRQAPATRPSRQEEQRLLVEEARRLPGVADAIEAYERMAGVADGYQRETTTIRFATGGNLPADRMV